MSPQDLVLIVILYLTNQQRKTCANAADTIPSRVSKIEQQ